MKTIFRCLSTLWLLLGISVPFVLLYGYLTLKSPDFKTNQSVQITHDIVSKEESQKEQVAKQKEAIYDESQIQPVMPEEYAQSQLDYEKVVNNWGIGSIYIPSSNIHSKILAGMSNENLMVALGTYYPDQTLGTGNYVLMAHNLMQGGGVLANLPNTAVGTVIYVTDFTTIFEYVVSMNQVVNQSEVTFLEVPDKADTPLMTIFRCEGGLHTPNRSLIQAEYKESYPASKGSTKVNKNLGLTSATTKTVMVKKTLNSNHSHTKESKSKVSNTEQSSSYPTKELKKETVKSIEHKFVTKKAPYSRLERASIFAFQVVNKSAIFVVLIWTGVMLSLEVSLHFMFRKRS